MAGIPIPEKHINLGESLILYVEDFHGTKVNIRKTYTKYGEDFLGKGLCVSLEDWEDIVSNVEDINSYIAERIVEIEINKEDE
jgi:hypothetical protein